MTKVDSLSKTDPFTAVEDLRSRGVDRIDVVIANAGAAHHYRLSELPVEFFEETVAVNSTAVLLLYQATLPLLRAAAEASPDKAAKFALISSGVGSIAGFANVVPWNMGAYGASKALANYLVVKMAKETDFLVTLCLNPG